MNEEKFAKCPTCTSLCKLTPVRELVVPTVYGEVVKYASLVPRILKSFDWMLKDIKRRAEESKPAGPYSSELIEAIGIFSILTSKHDSG